MIALRPGQRLAPNQTVKGEGLVLIYQSDGNFVVYRGNTPLWNSGSFDAPGYVEMQGDGNLVIYNASGVPYWATNTFGPNAVLEMTSAHLRVVTLSPTSLWNTPNFPEPEPGPTPPPGNVRKLVGVVRPIGRSFGDDTGPCIIHGCTDFGGIVKYYEDRDKSLRSLDVTSSHRQFIRVAYRLNGGFWTDSGLTVDPIRDAWWEPALEGYLRACNDRGLRVNLTCADMYNWSDQQAFDAITRTAQIAASVSPTVVILHEWNEIRGTSPFGEDDQRLGPLSDIWKNHYPNALRGGSDPGSQDKDGMKKLSPSPCNVCIIHNSRWTAEDAIRRAFNIMYEGYPDKSVIEGEPTGNENPTPSGQFNRKVFQPTEDHNNLLAIFSQHIFTGQMSTWFNDPALVSRYPLDFTWGFKEIPELWKLMEVPENVGQGVLKPGHHSDAPLQVNGSNALRADSVVIGGQSFGVISGGSNWKVKAGRSGLLTAYRGSGVVHEGNISTGQVIPISGPEATVIRIR